MFQQLISHLFTLLCLLILSGCASTKITGHAEAEVESPIRSIKITVASAQVAKFSYQQLSMNETIRDLFSLLPTRLPATFRANGIAVSDSAARYELVVLPSSAKYISYGGHVELTLNAYIEDRNISNRKVWQASLRFWRPGFSVVDERVVDEFAKALLTQLVADGAVSLGSNEIRLPSTSDL